MLKTSLLRLRLCYHQITRNMSLTNTIAVCQMTCTSNKEENLKNFRNLVQNACKNNAKFVFFPEAADYMASNPQESVAMAEELTGDTMSNYRQCAQENNVWISIGGFHEKSPDDNKKLLNSHVIINNEGEIVSVYRKVHLFDVQIPEKNINLQESSYVQQGDGIVAPISTPIGKLGLSICYDMRFPEISTTLRKLGAEILTYPSAFTMATGPAHWEALLRARAIENQCYVVAAAQYGEHNTKRQSYGHSLVVDPWGKIIAECEIYSGGKPQQDTCYKLCEIDLEALHKIRCEMPVLAHRRDDVYSLKVTNKPSAIGDEDYMFADKCVPASTVFFRSHYSYAFTNIRCVVPGHVLVTSLRVAKRLEDLTPDEVSDLFQTVVRVQKALETEHGSNSSNIAVQDGILSGQTIPHVHVHILPRRVGDFARNDDVYEQLAAHDRDANPTPCRSVQEMSAEAAALRKYF